MLYSVADPECVRGGGVSHILAEKRGVSFTLFKNMHENSIFSPITGGGVRRVRPMLDPPLVLAQEGRLYHCAGCTWILRPDTEA